MLPNTELMREARRFAERIASLSPNPAYAPVIPRAYLVGGVVRDIFLQQESKDADMEVYGVSVRDMQEQLEEMYPGRVDMIGKQFSVFHITFSKGECIDIAIPRRESKTGTGHTEFDVIGDPAMGVLEAAKRRDFTINAVLIDPITNEIIDTYGGVEDIKKRILRAVDESTFVEDPLRVYRAVQFVARFHLTIDPKTKQLLKRMIDQGELDYLPKERVGGEMRKLFFQSQAPSDGLSCMQALGIIEREYPELAALAETQQDPIWHPEGNVWTHTLLCVDLAVQLVHQASEACSDEQKKRIVFATLCHDLGKPATTTCIDGRWRSHGHAVAGETPTRSLLSRWCVNQTEIDTIVHLVRDHSAPYDLANEYAKHAMDDRAFGNALRRLMKRIYPATIDELLFVYESDSRGRTGDAEERKRETDAIRQTIVRIMRTQHIDSASLQPLISGDDLIALGLEPGIQFGALIQEVEKKRDEGTISTKEDALAFLRERITTR